MNETRSDKDTSDDRSDMREAASDRASRGAPRTPCLNLFSGSSSPRSDASSSPIASSTFFSRPTKPPSDKTPTCDSSTPRRRNIFSPNSASLSSADSFSPFRWSPRSSTCSSPPGLYKNERAAFLPFLVAAPLLFVLGAALVYLLIMPLAMGFFLSMQQSGDDGRAAIELMPRGQRIPLARHDAHLRLRSMLSAPVALTLAAKAGLVSADDLRAKRKYAIIAAFAAAAILTPPDPISQIGLAIPTIGLYEASILTVRLLERRRHRAERARADAASAT